MNEVRLVFVGKYGCLDRVASELEHNAQWCEGANAAPNFSMRQDQYCCGFRFTGACPFFAFCGFAAAPSGSKPT